MPQKRQSSGTMPVQMMVPVLAAFQVVAGLPSKKKCTGAASGRGTTAAAVSSSCGIPHLPFKPRGDLLVEQSRQVQVSKEPVQHEDDELEKVFKEISNYSWFDFLPLASFGRQGFISVTKI